jgi:hypothetical protein
MTEPSSNHPAVVLIKVAVGVITVAAALVAIITFCTGQSNLRSLVESLAKSKDKDPVSNTSPGLTEESNTSPSPTQDQGQIQQQPTESLPQNQPSQAPPEQVVNWFTATIENHTNYTIAYSVQNENGSYAEYSLQPGYHTTITLKNTQVIVNYDANTSDEVHQRRYQLNSLHTEARAPTEPEKQSAPISCFEEDENGSIVMHSKS